MRTIEDGGSMNRFALPTIFLLCGAFTLAACMSESRVQQVRQPSSSPSELSGDGRYFGYVKGGTPEPPTINFDIAQAFFGEEANRAAAEDGLVESGEPVPNDHYQRNPDARAEPLKLASSASVTAAWPASFLMQFVTPADRAKCREATPGSDACTQIPLSKPVFFEALMELSGRHGVPAWVTIEDGLVTRIDEQYYP
jgi:hypothetical protein